MIDKWNIGKEILLTLKSLNFSAYFVGGCVRDYVLNREPHDYDIATSAKPSEVMKIFQRTIPSGVKYGTVTVIMDDINFEVTTYRTDGTYTDNRHPKEIKYGVSAYEDVIRRDFTINGMLMDEDFFIIDNVEGKKDLELGIIRTIGDPKARFGEDALRILRAFYFQSKLGFSIEEKTLKAITDLRSTLMNLSSERVLETLVKIASEKNYSEAYKSMADSKVSEILPGLEKGIKFFSDKSVENFNMEIFFVTCFYFNKKVDPYYLFSNKTKHLFQTTIELLDKFEDFGDYEIYIYGTKICNFVSRVRSVIKGTPHLARKYFDMYDNLPIKVEKDIEISAEELIEITKKKPGFWIAQIQDELAKAILLRKLENKKEKILEYLKERSLI